VFWVLGSGGSGGSHSLSRGRNHPSGNPNPNPNPFGAESPHERETCECLLCSVQWAHALRRLTTA